MQLNKDTKTKLYLFLGVVLLLFAFWLVSSFKGHFSDESVGVIAADSAKTDTGGSGDLEYGEQTPDELGTSSENDGRLLRAVGKNTSTATIIVHIVGAVKVPGVYELPANARLHDALRAAKGFVANADREAVNLAEKISDGEQIVFPFITRGGEESSTPAPSSSRKSTSATSETKARSSRRSKAKSSGVVNINTASEEELTTLSGVGKATARAILKYRETKGTFATIEEITNVKGIGQKKFQKLRDYITVR